MRSSLALTTVAVVCVIAGALPNQSHASGQIVHVHTADKAAESVRTLRLQELLSDRRELFKFASLFPDAFSGGVREKIHATEGMTEFLNQYAQAIQDECDFSGSCANNRNIPCDHPGDFRHCKVPGSDVCDDTVVDSACPSGLRAENGECLVECDNDFDCPGIFNECRDRGVCDFDYTTPCGQFANPSGLGGDHCENGFCEDDYGLCDSGSFDNKCERLVTHFLGTIAHIISDYNADKFFVRTLAEREDCPSGLLAENETDPQLFTDQDMDAYLGRSNTVEDGPLVDFLPTSRLNSRSAVEDQFLVENVLQPLGFDEDLASFDVKMEVQWTAVQYKTTSDGLAWDFFACSEQPPIPSGYARVCSELSDGQYVECSSSFDCPIGLRDSTCRDSFVCEDKNNNGSFRRCTEDSDCPGSSNDCVVLGVCDKPEFFGANPEDCTKNSHCSGLSNRCLDWKFKSCIPFGAGELGCEGFGFCSPFPRYSRPRTERCEWAVQNPDNNWYFRGGGTLDTAREIAETIEAVWHLLDMEQVPKFRTTGLFADRALCVSTEGPDSNCLTIQALQVTGPIGDRIGTPSGTLSNWSEPRKVWGAEVALGTALFRFVSGESPITPVGSEPQVTCGESDSQRRSVDIDLNAGSPEEEARLERMTDIAMTAFVTGEKIQLRTELTECSSGDRYLVKDIRRLGDNRPPVAHAGEDQVVECGLAAELDGSGSTDQDSSEGTNDDIIRSEWFEFYGEPEQTLIATGERASVALPRGGHLLTLVVTDSYEESGTDDVLITVEDTLPPIVACEAELTLLWPPNHRMVDIGFRSEATDQCDDQLQTTTTVTTNEEPGSSGGKKNCPMAFVDEQNAVSVRASRAADGDGRLYVVTFGASDSAGHTSDCAAEVVVPHDRGEDPTSVDSDVRFDALAEDCRPPGARSKRKSGQPSRTSTRGRGNSGR